MQRSVPIQPKTSEICRKFANTWQRPYLFTTLPHRTRSLVAQSATRLAAFFPNLPLAGKGHNADVALSQLSLQVQTAFEMSSGADVFGKVKSMITEMIDKLVAEAAEEADHKAWCDKEMSEAQEKIADHTSMVDKLSSKIDKASASIAQITESVAELQAQLADIAKQQATMDEMKLNKIE